MTALSTAFLTEATASAANAGLDFSAQAVKPNAFVHTGGGVLSWTDTAGNAHSLTADPGRAYPVPYPIASVTACTGSGSVQFFTETIASAPTPSSGTTLATNTVNGIGKLSTAAVDPTVPIMVGDNDARMPPTPSGAGKILRDTGSAYAAVAAGTAHQLLHGGSAPAWGAVDLASADVTGTLPAANGGSGVASPSAHAVMIAEGSSAMTPVGPGATGTVLRGQTGADPVFGAVVLTSDVTGQLPVANVANGTSAQVLLTNSGATAPAWVSVSGDATITAAGAVTNAAINGTAVPATPAAAQGLLATDGTHAVWTNQAALVRTARNVVVSNVASLAAYTVASAALNDNVSGGNIQNDRVLLVAQSTVAQNGLYSVGVVGGGTAPLTRVTDVPTGAVAPPVVEISEGTVFAGKRWKSFATTAGGPIAGTNDPVYYPVQYTRITSAMSGTPGTKALSAEWIFSATNSFVGWSVKTPGTQGFLSVGTLSTGAGTGSFTVTSTANETSTLYLSICN